MEGLDEERFARDRQAVRAKTPRGDALAVAALLCMIAGVLFRRI